MGIIKDQSVKNSILSYFGVAIGVISALLIYPLNTEAYGLAQFLYSTAFFLLPFASFGITSGIIKFFPRFRTTDSNEHNGFLFLILSIGLSGFVAFLIVFFLFQPYIISFLSNLGFDQNILVPNIPYILSLLLLLLLIFIFTFFLNNMKEIVVPNFLHLTLYKIFLPIIIFLNFKQIIENSTFSLSIVIYFIFVLIALIIYTMYLGQFNLKPFSKGFITKPLRREIISYLSYSNLNIIGNTLAFRIDLIMVAMMLGFQMTGTYGILFALAGTIDIPNQSIIQIAAPVISDSWEKNDIKEINNIYRKSSITLITFGTFLFLGTWLCLDSILELSTNTKLLSSVKYIFFFLGLAKLIDMVTGVNTQIIIFSKYFKYNLIFILILGIVNVVSNYFLILEFNVVGAAMATFAAMLIINLVKLLFIYIKVGIHPFSKSTGMLLIIGMVSYAIAFYIPNLENPFLNIFVKGSVFSILYIPAILFYNISPEINLLINQYYTKVMNRLK